MEHSCAASAVVLESLVNARNDEDLAIRSDGKVPFVVVVVVVEVAVNFACIILFTWWDVLVWETPVSVCGGGGMTSFASRPCCGPP